MVIFSCKNWWYRYLDYRFDTHTCSQMMAMGLLRAPFSIWAPIGTHTPSESSSQTRPPICDLASSTVTYQTSTHCQKYLLSTYSKHLSEALIKRFGEILCKFEFKTSNSKRTLSPNPWSVLAAARPAVPAPTTITDGFYKVKTWNTFLFC